MIDYMARALDLAERAKGTCNPNPAVGALLVRDGQIVGEEVPDRALVDHQTVGVDAELVRNA